MPSKITALCNFFELFKDYGDIDGTPVCFSGTWYEFSVESISSTEVFMTKTREDKFGAGEKDEGFDQDYDRFEDLGINIWRCHLLQ